MVSRIVNVEWTSSGATRVTTSMKEIELQAAKTAASVSTSTKTQAAAADAQLTKLGGSFKSAQGGLKGVASGIGALGGGATVAASAGLIAVGVGLESIVNAGRDQERALRLTQAVLESTGGAANVTASQVSELATKLSVITGVEDQVVQHGENVLLTFRSVRNEAGKGNDIFTQGTKAALDLSAALGQDLQSSVIQIGKALNDPIRGMTALRRVGVSFTESQQQQIKTLTESGHLLLAQKVILGELTAEFGGAAAAAADPFSKLNASVKELKESLGTALIPTLNVYVGILSKAVNLISTSTSGGGKENPFVQFAKGAAQLVFLGPLSFLGKSKDDADAATKAVQRLDAAQKQLVKDSAANAPKSTLAADANEVRAAQAGVTAITNRANAALGDNAQKSQAAGFSYLSLAGNAKTAAAAIKNVSDAAFNPIRLSISADTAQTNVNQAIDALNNPQQSSSGGGGSGETPTAALLNHIQQEHTLRDALLGVGDAARGVTTAEQQLNQARTAANASQLALTQAENNYRTVLQGVARDSQAAKDATDALKSAQNQAAGSQIGVRDARRALEQARNDRALAKFAVTDARNQLARDLKGTPGTTTTQFVPTPTGSKAVTTTTGGIGPASAEQIAKDRIALKDAEIAESGAADQVRKAQIALSDAQIAAHKATKDATEAQRIYNGTMNGFPPASKEAQAAQQNLTQAYQNAQQAAQSVVDAQRSLITATNNTEDATLALRHAQADLAGKLTSSGNAASNAGTKFDSLRTRIDNAKGAILDYAQQAAAADIAIGHSAGFAFLHEIGILKAYAATSPLLAGVFNQALSQLQTQYMQYLNANPPPAPVGPPSGASPYGTDAAGYGPTLPPKHRAMGGPLGAGELAIVGENGPELFRPRTAGEVVPPSSLRNSVAVGGQSPTFNFYIGTMVGSDQEAERIVHKVMRSISDKNGSITGVRVSD